MNKESKIILIVSLVAIVGGILLWSFQPKPALVTAPVDGSLLIREGSHVAGINGVEGAKNAKVQIVEFGDYQCPACGAVNPIVMKIIADYKDNPNVSFVFRNFPLSAHQNSHSSAEAAEAASAQGKFWEMHDMIYEKQTEWSNSNTAVDIFTSYASKLGLDTKIFLSEVKSNKYSAIISADYADGEKLGVDSTPTFYINGVKFGDGVSSYDSFKAKIEELLKK